MDVECEGDDSGGDNAIDDERQVSALVGIGSLEAWKKTMCKVA